jgi:gustatory receptor
MQPQDVKFEWISMKFLISLIFIACNFTTACFVLKDQIKSGPLTPANIIRIIYFSTCVTISILFVKVAAQWKSFMVKWTQIEIEFLCSKYEKPPNEWSLRKRIAVFLTIAFLMAFLEHILSLSDQIYRFALEANYCNFTIEDQFGYFVQKYQEYVINNLPFSYNNFVGAIVVFLNYSYTFWWNFLDIFSILISIGLSDLFERFNHRLKGIKALQLDAGTW